MEPQTPWPYLKANAAAKRLGVRLELINGLACDRRIRAVKTHGKSGAVVWLLNREDIDALAQQIGSD